MNSVVVVVCVDVDVDVVLVVDVCVDVDVVVGATGAVGHTLVDVHKSNTKSVTLKACR